MLDERTIRRAVLIAVTALVATSAVAVAVARPGDLAESDEAGTDDGQVAADEGGGVADDGEQSTAPATARELVDAVRTSGSIGAVAVRGLVGVGRPVAVVVTSTLADGAGVELVPFDDRDAVTVPTTTGLTSTETPTPSPTSTEAPTPTDEPVGPVEITGGCLGGDGVVYVFGDATAENPVFVTVRTDDGDEAGDVVLETEADSNEVTSLPNGTYTVDAETESGAPVPVTRSSVTLECEGV